MLVCSAGTVRRACLERVRDFDAEIRRVEDADFYLRIMRECGARFIDRVALRDR
jgi:hypothetical protein